MNRPTSPAEYALILALIGLGILAVVVLLP
jgi:Flp pilus assembly pilin Flp